MSQATDNIQYHFEEIIEFNERKSFHCTRSTRVYPNVSGLATWSEDYKMVQLSALGAVVSSFCESV
jgi:hypothetical protein